MQLLGLLGNVLREIVRIGVVIAGAVDGLAVVVAGAADAAADPAAEVGVAVMVVPDTRKPATDFHRFARIVYG